MFITTNTTLLLLPQDSEVYSTVLNRLNPARCPLITDEALLARAGKAINYAKDIGADVFLKPKVRRMSL